MKRQMIMEVVDRILTEWSSRWPCRFSDPKRAGFFAEVSARYSLDPMELEGWWAAFCREMSSSRNGPSLNDWERFLKEQVAFGRTARYDGQNGGEEEICAFCGGTGLLVLASPWSERWREEPSVPGFVIGEPWTGARLERVTVPCKCRNPEGEGMKASWRSFRQEGWDWLTECLQGRWRFAAGEELKPWHAVTKYLRRFYGKDWKACSSK